MSLNLTGHGWVLALLISLQKAIKTSGLFTYINKYRYLIYENLVSKHFVISLNFPCLSLFAVLFAYVGCFGCLVVNPHPPSLLLPSLKGVFPSLPRILCLTHKWRFEKCVFRRNSWKDLKRDIRVLKCMYVWNIRVFCIKTKTEPVWRNQPSVPMFQALKICMVA